MKVGIQYCGGCNPHIDRKLLTKQLKEKLEPYTGVFEYFDFHDCEAVVVLNGCSVACAEIPKHKNTIIVSGSQIDGKQYQEENLPREVIERLPISFNLKPLRR